MQGKSKLCRANEKSRQNFLAGGSVCFFMAKKPLMWVVSADFMRFFCAHGADFCLWEGFFVRRREFANVFSMKNCSVSVCLRAEKNNA